MRACHIKIDTNLLIALAGEKRVKVSEQRGMWRKVFNLHGLRSQTRFGKRGPGHEFCFADFVTTDGIALCVHFTAERTPREQVVAEESTK
jgi:hypothetical protein